MPLLTNAKHEAVAQAYIVDPERIGADAYRAIYPKSSKRAAATAWTRLLKNKAFAARLDELLGVIAEKAELTGAEVLEEIRRVAFANMADYMRAGPDGDPVLDFSALTREQAACLVEVSVEDFKDGRGDDARDVRRVKFKLADKLGALGMLGKHFGLLKERHLHELTGKDGGAIEVEQRAPRDVAKALLAAVGGGK